MKRCNSSLYALAVATGAGLLFAVPAMAQTYTTYTDNFEAVPVANRALINGPVSDNYNYTQEAQTAFVLNTTATGRKLSAGAGTSAVPMPFPNHAEGATGSLTEGPVGSKSINFCWQADTTPGDPNNQGATTNTSFMGYTAATNAINGNTTQFDNYATVSMTGLVSFDVYVDTATAADQVTSGNPGNSMLFELEISGDNTGVSASDMAALGKAGSGTDNLWMVGATPTNGATNGGTTTPSGLPTGGKAVSTGSWQTVTFYLGVDPHTAVNGATSYPTSGLGDIVGIYATPVGPVPNGQKYSVNIDNLTISAAPEPSAWIGLAAGGAMLLGLGLVSARRRRGVNAA